MPVDFSLQPGQWRPALFYWLASVGKITYPGHDDFRDRVLQIPGPCTWEFFEVHPGDLPGAILANYGNWWLLSIHGTQTGWQWVYNLIGTVPTFGDGLPGFTHAYFTGGGREISNYVKTRLPVGADNPTVPILITGHSLGGALAQTAAFYLDGFNQYRTSGVVTFGSPKVGNAAFAAGATWPVIRLENTFDPVVQVPPGISYRTSTPFRTIVWDALLAYQHAGASYRMNANSRVDGPDPGSLQGFDSALLDELLRSSGPADLIAHYPTTYLSRIRGTLPIDLSLTTSTVENLDQLDVINAELYALEKRPWGFPAIYPIEPDASQAFGGHLPALPSAFASDCPGVPGQRCCRMGGH